MSSEEDFFMGCIDPTVEINISSAIVTSPEDVETARPDEIPSAENSHEQVRDDLPKNDDPEVGVSGDHPTDMVPPSAEDEVATEATKKSKKKSSKKRKRGEISPSGEPSRLVSRLVDYRELGFYKDSQKAADVLFAVKPLDASASAGSASLQELEVNEAYKQYARTAMKNQALLNEMFVEYQTKLNDARQRLKDAEQSEEMMAKFKKLQLAHARMAEELKAEKEEHKADLEAKSHELDKKNEALIEVTSLAESYRQQLDEKSDHFGKTLLELQALGEYTRGVKDRADLLRERLVYLNLVSHPMKKAENLRSNIALVKTLVERGAKMDPKVLGNMEHRLLDYETKVKEVDPVEINDEDLVPIDGYVPQSNRFAELLGAKGPDEHKSDHPDPPAQDPPGDQSIEEVEVDDDNRVE